MRRLDDHRDAPRRRRRPARRRAARPTCPIARAPAPARPRPARRGPRRCAAPGRRRPARRAAASRVPVTVGQVGEPALDAWRRPTRPPSRRRARRSPGASGPSGSLASPTSSAAARALGERRRDRAQERDLLVVEHRLAGLAVEARARPRPPRAGVPQRGDQLLVAAELHVRVPRGAAARIAAGGLVQRRDPPLRARRRRRAC